MIGILAVIGSAVLFELTSVQSAANSKLGTAEISEIKKALLDFRRDTGSLPGQGVFRRVVDGGAVEDTSMPANVQAMSASQREAWFESPANFWQLFVNPLPASEALASWDPAYKRGWNGPYLSRPVDRFARVGVVGSDGLDDPFAPSGGVVVDGVWSVPDPHTFAESVLPKWFRSSGAELKKQGRPYLLFDADNASARIVSVGVDGQYGLESIASAGNDDVILFLFQ